MGNKIKQRFLRKISPYAGAALVGLFGLILFPVSFSLDSAEAAITYSETILTLSTSDLSARITPSDANGTFVASDPSTISVTTNNYSGYTLGIAASDNVNNTKLINTSDDTAYLTSISSASSADEFNTNNWGYLPSKLNSQTNISYRPAPTTTGATIETTNSANAEANTYTISLGVKTDYTLPAGTYKNTFTLTAVANPTTYSIIYNKNTTDEVANFPSAQSSSTNGNYVRISSNTPTRAGYTFMEWNTADDGTGTSYQPNYYIALDQTSANTTTLYAQWAISFNNAFADANKETVTVSGKQYYKLQDMEPAICTAVDTDQTGQLVDIRDNLIYNVKKMADGRCWIIDNLALDLTDSDILNGLSATNTNASNNSLNYLKNGGGTTSDKYATTSVVSGTSSVGGYSVPLDGANYRNADYYRLGGDNDDVALELDFDVRVGDYYNFCAASAGSYCYGNNDINSASAAGTSVGDATEDICPTGWRLPTGGDSGEFSVLTAAVTDINGRVEDQDKVNLFRTEFLAWLTTRYYEGTIMRDFVDASFWSSSRYDDKIMYSVYYTSAFVNPTNTTFGDRMNGIPIRCVAYNGPKVTVNFNANGGTGTMDAQNLGQFGGVLNFNTFTRANYDFNGWNTAADGSGTSYVNGATYTGTSTTLYAQWKLSKIYMQDVTTATCPTERTLVYDSRDENPYYIQKIGSLCWMTSNLNIAGGTTLTSAKSNVASSYTLPASSTAGFKDNTKAYVYNDSTYGGYYSYVAATAGINPSSGNSTYDICPAGWKLPSISNYNTLKVSYSTGDTLTAAPWYGTYGGDYSYSSAGGVGSRGYYWSSTAGDSTLAYYVLFDSSSVNLYGNNKFVGYSVRCIAQ